MFGYLAKQRLGAALTAATGRESQRKRLHLRHGKQKVNIRTNINKLVRCYFKQGLLIIQEAK